MLRSTEYVLSLTYCDDLPKFRLHDSGASSPVMNIIAAVSCRSTVVTELLRVSVVGRSDQQFPPTCLTLPKRKGGGFFLSVCPRVITISRNFGLIPDFVCVFVHGSEARHIA